LPPPGASNEHVGEEDLETEELNANPHAHSRVPSDDGRVGAELSYAAVQATRSAFVRRTRRR
jgi:hypothetical protein